jgi:hypothetical protein
LYTYETVITLEPGTGVPVEVTLQPLTFADEQLVCLTARDITEKKQVEELRMKAFTQIGQNIRQFALLNDQIRNPLTIILTIAEDLSDQEALAIISEVKKIDRVVDSIDKGFIESEKVYEFLRKHFY